MKIALASCAEWPNLDADDEPLVTALRRRGAEVTTPPWDAGDAPFFDADLTVIRSTWDYTRKADAFIAWAERLERRSPGRLLNPAGIVRWSAHKRYLLELEAAGTAIVPTVLLPAGSRCVLADLLRARGWMGGAVVKPAVSAGSRDTLRIEDGEEAAGQAHLDRLLPSRDVLIQPFLPGIFDGECSLVYLAREGRLQLGHAVNKRPRAGDFRTQPEFESRIEVVAPLPEWRAAADALVAGLGGELLYARVDLVADGRGAPLLMELELIEPCLYLRWGEASAERLADEVTRRCGLLGRGA